MQRVRKNDVVVVIAGKDKGSRGKVLKVFPERNRVLVEGLNRVKRHQKVTQKIQQGGIIEKEMPIHLSNVMPLDPKTEKPTRVRSGKAKDGSKTRVSAKSGTVLES